MNARHDQIADEVYNAYNEVDVLFDERQAAGLDDDDYVSPRILASLGRCSQLAAADDYDNIAAIVATPKTSFLGEVIVDSLAELRFAYRMYGEATGYEYDERFPSRVSLAVDHEGEHSAAYSWPSICLAENLYFGIQMRRRGTDVFQAGAFISISEPVSRITKLARGSAVLFPEVPSSSDIANLTSMGYDDIEQLEAKIRAYNLAHADKPLPLNKVAYSVRAQNS